MKFLKAVKLGLCALLALTVPLKLEAKHHPHGGEHFDFIVVGMGAGGAVVAARLAEDPNVKVAIIEAGGNFEKNPLVQAPYCFPFLWNNPLYPPPLQSPPYDPPYDEWSFETVGINQLYDTPYQYPRGVGFGGSSAHHAMLAMRGDKPTYDDWAEITGDHSWKYDNILKYFKKSEDNHNLGTSDHWHGRDGWLSIRRIDPTPVDTDLIRAGVAAGYPFVKDFLGNPDEITGIGFADSMLHNQTGIRSYAAQDLLSPMLKKHKNITIIDKALALKVLFKKRHGKQYAVGVEYQKGPFNYEADTQFTPSFAETQKVYAHKEVILSGGAINTPQLMMLSGLGPKDHLESFDIPVVADLPGVGSNLQDHLEVFVNYQFAKPFYFTSDTINALDLVDPNDPAYQNFLISGRGPYDAVGDVGVLDWFSGIDTDNPLVPDLHIQFKNAYFQDFNIDDWLLSFDPTFSHGGFVIEDLHPVGPYGTIRLKSSNPHDTPLIDENLANEHNAKVVATGVILARELYNQPFDNYGVPTTVAQRYQATEVGPLASVPSDVDQLASYIQDNSAFGHHISCTCRMGKKDDPMAVTDSKLLVRHVKHLRIVDTSVFPKIPGGNPCVPVTMVAEKASDMIKKKHHLHSHSSSSSSR